MRAFLTVSVTAFVASACGSSTVLAAAVERGGNAYEFVDQATGRTIAAGLTGTLGPGLSLSDLDDEGTYPLPATPSIGTYGRGNVVGERLAPGTNAMGTTVANESTYYSLMPGAFDASTGLYERTELNVTVQTNIERLVVYFGFYWGSIDLYNHVRIGSRVTDASGNEVSFDSYLPIAGDARGFVSGQQMVDHLNGQGAGLAMYDSFYLNVLFPPLEQNSIVYVGFATTGISFEMDNFAFETRSRPTGAMTAARVGALAVPAPGALALFGLAFAGLAARRRRTP